MAVVGLLLLPLIAIVTISAAIVATYRHAELRVVYKGDADKRDRDAWKPDDRAFDLRAAAASSAARPRTTRHRRRSAKNRRSTILSTPWRWPCKRLGDAEDHAERCRADVADAEGGLRRPRRQTPVSSRDCRGRRGDRWRGIYRRIQTPPSD